MSALPGPPELETLASWLGCWLDGEALTIDAVSPEILRLAHDQRVAPILYDLAGAASGRAASPLLTATRPAFYRTLLRNDALLDTALRATSALHQAGIPVIRLKGSELLCGVYSSPGLRPMDDVDLLVPRAHAAGALAVLERADFRAPAGLLSLGQYLEHHFHLPLADPVRGDCLELHWELLDRYKRGGLGGAELWQRALPIDPERPELGLRLDAETAFLYLALHVDKHGPFHDLVRRRRGAAAALLHPSSEARLLWLVDLAVLARERPPDPDRLVSLARVARVERAAAATLALGCSLLGAARLPRLVLDPEPMAPWRRLVNAATARLLLLPGGRMERWLTRARRMDETAQVRPLRLLELPLLLFPPFGEFRRERDLGRIAALLWYPRHVARELWSGARFAVAVSRARARERSAMSGLSARSGGGE